MTTYILQRELALGFYSDSYMLVSYITATLAGSWGGGGGASIHYLLGWLIIGGFDHDNNRSYSSTTGT